LRLEPFAAIAAHPEAARIEGLCTTALDRALSARAMTLVAQPADTIASPFLIDPRSARPRVIFAPPIGFSTITAI